MNPWKIATIALALVFVTGLTTGLTTAYLMRPATPTATAFADDASSLSVVPRVPAAPATATVPASRSVARPRVVPAVQRTAAPEPTRTIEQPAPVSRPAPVATGSVRPVSDTAAECATTGDRVWRIAKPGLVGTVLGAGMGAAGGAIADGGKGAGKGAMIGGLAGAALGSVYGAYKTKQECGTVLGGSSAPGFAGNGPSGGDLTHASADGAAGTQAAFSARAPRESGDSVTIYNVR
jgi:hypothetical protein